ncbi:sensor histidine kinase [Denitrobaculum tricleocarpae]|uniref:histidine kinase n=1 Tax=Denitrobaculum tricleocarpae TaxID=2591009 RepID=A0A545U1J1_9PROT|nr:HAMP domain-containing sensor histidine kinase [Denitrobaculum tricleocarpae]TQV83328.1 HAMP domain-containing histidine kinase [Denitrobaculum tricleocarpae]
MNTSAAFGFNKPVLENVAQKLGLPESSHHVRLVRRFVILSFIAIVATNATLGFFLSDYLTRQMSLQDAIEASESLNALVHAEGAAPAFGEGFHAAERPEMTAIFRYLQVLPDVYLATVYRADGTMIWSTDPTLNTLTEERNLHLAAALSGELNPVVRPISLEDSGSQSGVPDGTKTFVTFTVPIWSHDQTSVVGAIEIRKVPETLLGSIDRVYYLTWTSEAWAGALLFCCLLIVVLYTTRVLKRHEAKLMERERLAGIGEMASSVAHGLRNPLAAIRSCAELALDDDLPESARGPVKDIVDQSDRLESWIRSFLTSALEDPVQVISNASVDHVIAKCLKNFKSQMEDRGIRVEFVKHGSSPLVTARPAELEQVLNSILSNSIEATESGGTIKISRAAQPDGQTHILVEDNGSGIPTEIMRRLFRPFQTGKPTGLGVGLVLARRVLERLGGSLELRNRKNRGVEVICTIPTCDGFP